MGNTVVVIAKYNGTGNRPARKNHRNPDNVRFPHFTIRKRRERKPARFHFFRSRYGALPVVKKVNIPNMIIRRLSRKAEIQIGHQLQCCFVCCQMTLLIKLPYGTGPECFSLFYFSSESIPFRNTKSPFLPTQEDLSPCVDREA